MTRFTPTQLRILEMLADGGLHPKSELMECLGDGSEANLRQHVSLLRTRLRRHGQGIQCENGGYRRVRYGSNTL